MTIKMGAYVLRCKILTILQNISGDVPHSPVKEQASKKNSQDPPCDARNNRILSAA